MYVINYFENYHIIDTIKYNFVSKKFLMVFALLLFYK